MAAWAELEKSEWENANAQKCQSPRQLSALELGLSFGKNNWNGGCSLDQNVRTAIAIAAVLRMARSII